MARNLAVWFRKTFNDRGFAPGPFVPPPDPSDVQVELDRLQVELAELTKSRYPIQFRRSSGLFVREAGRDHRRELRLPQN